MKLELVRQGCQSCISGLLSLRCLIGGFRSKKWPSQREVSHQKMLSGQYGLSLHKIGSNPIAAFGVLFKLSPTIFNPFHMGLLKACISSSDELPSDCCECVKPSVSHRGASPSREVLDPSVTCEPDKGENSGGVGLLLLLSDAFSLSGRVSTSSLADSCNTSSSPLSPTPSATVPTWCTNLEVFNALCCDLKSQLTSST